MKKTDLTINNMDENASMDENVNMDENAGVRANVGANASMNILKSVSDFQVLLGALLSGLGTGFQQAMNKQKKNNNLNINNKSVSTLGSRLQYFSGGENASPLNNSNNATIQNAKMTRDGINIASTVVSGLTKQVVSLSDTFWSTLIDVATGGVLEKKWTELTPELEKRVLTLAATLDAMSRNPEVVRAVREIGVSLSLMGVDVIQAIQPSLEEIANKSWESLEKIGSTSLKGGVDTAVSFAQAMLAEIPMVGGIIDLFIAGGKGLNNMAKIINEFTQESSKYIEPVGKMIKKGNEAIQKGQQRIQNIQNNLSKLENIGNVQRGGKKINVKKNIRKTTLRIRKSLTSFQKNKLRKHRKKTLKKRRVRAMAKAMVKAK